MSDFGLTSYGVNIKRLDTILEEMHTDLSEKCGVNTQQNPNSFLNVLLTNVADMIAELWELGQDVYNSQYPSTAEGMYLDNVGQFAGVMRASEAPSYYHILCTGADGTLIPTETIISSTTNPITNLRPTTQNIISRDNFNIAAIRAVSIDGNPLTVALNGSVYSVTPARGTTESTALASLAETIVDDDFVATIGETDGLLYITAIQETSINSLLLSDNLTTESVSSVFTFQTEDVGDIYLPAGAITTITRAVTGLNSVTNVGTYIAGREKESDSDYRKSYMEKIFSHSERMSNSIRSAILNNCQGVSAIAVYENDSNTTDSYGRYPHSVEVVVDGGDETEIAQQILNTKAGGISTYGSVEISLTGDYGEELLIRFSRPDYLYLWFHVEITIARNATLPTNYADLIREIILSKMNSLDCGEDVIPQNLFFPDIYTQIYGVGFIEMTIGVGVDRPATFTERNVYATIRERCITRENMIEVVING